MTMPAMKRDDEAAFVGELERPADAEFLQIGGRDHGEIGVAAGDPARIGKPNTTVKATAKRVTLALSATAASESTTSSAR